MTTRTFGWGLLLLLVLMATTMAFVDLPLAQAIGRESHTMKEFFVAITKAGEYLVGYHITPYLPVLVLGAGAALVAYRARQWRASLPLLYVSVLVVLVRVLTDGAKLFFQRMRPPQVLEQPDIFPGFFTQGSSFPSGHVTYFLSLGLGLALILPRRWWLTALILLLPVLISAGRVVQNLHFCSDVLGGATLVWVLAYVLWHVQLRLQR